MDGFTITIIFIALSTVVTAFVRRTQKDKCLKNFANYLIRIEKTDNKIICGKLNVENTGLELVYAKEHLNEASLKTSYILYKNEYPNIRMLLRYHDELSEKEKKQRQKDLSETYHPTFPRRLRRKTINIFKTIKDSIAEVVNILISRAKKTDSSGVFTSQDKYVSQMKQGLMNSVGTSFEPLLEKYIGHIVVLELVKNDEILEYAGVLKEYTANFIELMDVDFEAKKADIIVPRNYAAVRHLGE